MCTTVIWSRLRGLTDDTVITISAGLCIQATLLCTDGDNILPKPHYSTAVAEGGGCQSLLCGAH